MGLQNPIRLASARCWHPGECSKSRASQSILSNPTGSEKFPGLWSKWRRLINHKNPQSQRREKQNSYKLTIGSRHRSTDLQTEAAEIQQMRSEALVMSYSSAEASQDQRSSEARGVSYTPLLLPRIQRSLQKVTATKEISERIVVIYSQPSSQSKMMTFKIRCG